MNDENLVSLASRTTNEKRAIGIKGGQASGKARREKRDAKKILEDILARKPKRIDDQTATMLEDFGFKAGSTYDVMLFRAVMRAMYDDKGANEATKIVLQALGQDKPTEEIDGSVMEEHNAALQTFSLRNGTTEENRSLEDFENEDDSGKI